MPFQNVDLNLPIALVNEKFDQFTEQTQELFEAAQELAEDLADFSAPHFFFNINFDMPAGVGAPFTKPPVPEQPDVEFQTISEVPDVSIGEVTVPDVGTAPEFTGEIPTFQPSPKPGALSVSAPGDEPVVSDITLPDAPTITMPDAPTLREFTLPDVPTITLPTFNETIPPIDFTAPNPNFVYTETEYTSDLLAEVTARVRTMLQGGTGLPAFIEQALFDRARVREDIIARKAVVEVMDEWSARGFTLPQGELNRRLAEVRQINQDKVSSLERDILIEAAKWEIENLRFAVQQGIALESILINLFNSVQQRRFDVAKFTLEASIQIFNAHVLLYNARLEAFKTQAEVYKIQIEAELAKIEVYKAQLEGVKTIAEINELDVRIYVQQVQALETTINLYKAQIEGARAQVDVDRARVEVYRARIEGFAAIVSAKKSEFEAWAEEVKGESAKFGAYESEARAFAARVEGFRAQIEANLMQPKMQIEAEKLKIEKYDADLGGYVARVNAEAQRLSATVNLFEGQARMYAAELSAESARAMSDTRQFELNLRRAEAEAGFQLEDAKLFATTIQESARLTIQALSSAAQVMSQLAAGSMSAVGMSASVSSAIDTSENAQHLLEGNSGLT